MRHALPAASTAIVALPALVVSRQPSPEAMARLQAAIADALREYAAVPAETMPQPSAEPEKARPVGRTGGPILAKVTLKGAEPKPEAKAVEPVKAPEPEKKAEPLKPESVQVLKPRPSGRTSSRLIPAQPEDLAPAPVKAKPEPEIILPAAKTPPAEKADMESSYDRKAQFDDAVVDGIKLVKDRARQTGLLFDEDAVDDRLFHADLCADPEAFDRLRDGDGDEHLRGGHGWADVPWHVGGKCGTSLSEVEQEALRERMIAARERALNNWFDRAELIQDLIDVAVWDRWGIKRDAVERDDIWRLAFPRMRDILRGRPDFRDLWHAIGEWSTIRQNLRTTSAERKAAAAKLTATLEAALAERPDQADLRRGVTDRAQLLDVRALDYADAWARVRTLTLTQALYRHRLEVAIRKGVQAWLAETEARHARRRAECKDYDCIPY